MQSALQQKFFLLPSMRNKKRWYAVKFLEKDSKVAESVKLTDSAAKEDRRVKSWSGKSLMMTIWKVS